MFMRTKGDRAHSFLRPIVILEVLYNNSSLLKTLTTDAIKTSLATPDSWCCDPVSLSQVDIAIVSFSPKLPLSQVPPYVSNHLRCNW